MKKADQPTPVTLFLADPDRAALLGLLQSTFGTSVVPDGPASSWKKCVIGLTEGVEVRLELKAKKRPGDEFSKILLGMWNFVREAKLPAAAKRDVETNVLKTQLLVGVVTESAVPATTGDVFEKLLQVVAGRRGYMFDGERLIAADGVAIEARRK